MSATLGPDNPIILFGDEGPDIKRLSQIYNPDRDRFVLSTDETAVGSKTYYRRKYENRVISYEEVIAPATPQANGYYEINPDFADTVYGTYVPAAHSLVVVDIKTGDYNTSTNGVTYPVRSVLIVESVDDQGENPSFRSTLVPLNYGNNVESSARSLDYGNDRYMLYFEKVTTDGSAIRIIPDRKLALYGRYMYAYRILRGPAQEIISAPTIAISKKTNNALVPYAGATSEQQTLSTTNYHQFEGESFTVLCGNNYRTITVPPGAPADDTIYVESLDTVYVPGKTYFKGSRDTSGNVTIEYTLTPGTDYTPGVTPVGVINGADVGPAAVFNQMRFDPSDTSTTVRTCTLDEVFGAAGAVGYITTPDADDGVATIHYPEAGYCVTGVSLVNGEAVTMEVFEWKGGSFRMVLSINMIVKEGILLDASAASTKRVVDFRVDASSTEGVTEEDGAWLLPIGHDVRNWVFTPHVVYDDGTEDLVAIDDKKCFVFGLENISSYVTAGTTFPLLFKYFAASASGLDSNLTKHFVTFEKRVKVVNNASLTIRKLSVVPCWNYTTQKYEFRYVVYRTDTEGIVQEPIIMDNLDFLVGLVQVQLESATYRDINDNIRAISTGAVGDNLGYYQHVGVVLAVSANGYATSVYKMRLAIRLQNWIGNLESKWLIGEYSDTVDPTTGVTPYSADETPYGSSTLGVRPYVTYYPAEDTAHADTFQVGTRFRTVGEFLENFYYAGLGRDGVGAERPDCYRVRTLATLPIYDALSSTTALKGVEYYSRTTGKKVGVIVGETIVTDLAIKVQDNLTYFTRNASDEYVQVTGLTVGTVLTAAQVASYFIGRTQEVVSGYIPISENDTDEFVGSSTFSIGGTGVTGVSYLKNPSWKATEMVGGIFPDVVGDTYSTQVMGLCIVEFARRDSGGTYRYLYGVPVEIRYPYVPTTDLFYQEKDYYIFNPETHRFDLETDYLRDGTQLIPQDQKRFEVRNAEYSGDTEEDT